MTAALSGTGLSAKPRDISRCRKEAIPCTEAIIVRDSARADIFEILAAPRARPLACAGLLVKLKYVGIV